METRKVLREIRGAFSKEEWAAETGISVPTIYNWERKKKPLKPSRQLLVVLAQFAEPGLYLKLLESLELLPLGYLAEADAASLRMRAASRAGNMPR